MKKLILISIFLFTTLFGFSQRQTQSWWSLKYSKQYSDVWVTSFDSLLSPTGGGYFRWVKTSNNASITDIPGIRIKPRYSTKGYWKRIDAGPVQVDWMGVVNTSSQLTWSGYGYTQNRLDSMFGSGQVSTTDYPDGTAIRAAFRLMQTRGYQSVSFSGNIYYIADTLWLPRDLSPSPGYAVIYNIEGNGAELNAFHSYTGNMIDRYCADAADAVDLSRGLFNISNLTISGGGSNDQKGLRLVATSGSKLSFINPRNCGIGIELSFCLNTTIDKPNIVNCTYIGLNIRHGDFSGGNVNDHGSNSCLVLNPRIKGTDSMYCYVQILASSDCRIINLVQENSASRPTFGVVYNYLNANVVKDLNIIGSHDEGITDSAMFLITATSGVYNIWDAWVQGTGGALVWQRDPNGNPQVNLWNMTYWPSGTYLIHEDAANWDFNNVKNGIADVTELRDTSNHIWNLTTGTLPAASRLRVIPTISN